MATPTPESTFRVGVRFESVASAIQVQIDRYVFALMQKRARAIRRDAADRTERRVASRVEIPGSQSLQLVLLPTLPVGALSANRQTTQQTFVVNDISTTGCSFVCADPDLLKAKQTIRLALRSKDQTFDIELQARVIYIQHA